MSIEFGDRVTADADGFIRKAGLGDETLGYKIRENDLIFGTVYEMKTRDGEDHCIALFGAPFVCVDKQPKYYRHIMCMPKIVVDPKLNSNEAVMVVSPSLFNQPPQVVKIVNVESADGSDHVVLDGNEKTGSHWHWKTKEFGKPVIAVDFHHVITTHCSACPGEKLQDTSTNGKVQDGCIKTLIELAKTYKIMIYTGAGEFWDEQHRKLGIEDWLKSHGVPYDEIRYGKPPACFIIDDRAIHHVGWKNTLLEIRRRENIKRDSYWGQPDDFSHDCYELYAGAYSPEQFIAKWGSLVKT